MRSWSQRLGCACKLLGEPLPTSDNRRPQNQPHLRHSLEMLPAVFDYLQRAEIRMFRLPSNLAPYATHPDHPQLAWAQQRQECQAQLGEVGRLAHAAELRLSFHPSQFILLSSPDRGVVERSLKDLRWQCELLDDLGCSPEARVLLHVGGVYGDRPGTRERVLRELEALPEVIRRRFALENDDVCWSAEEVLELCQTSGIPMIYDLHHHHLLHREHEYDPARVLRAALATWPEGVLPKIHLSSPRQREPEASRRERRAHHDYIHPDDLQQLVDISQGLPDFDVMLEAKAKDLAVLRAAEWLQQHAQ